MIFGYARVSTREQNLNLQTDALKKAGCERIFQEKVSGRSPNRPELLKLLEHIRRKLLQLYHFTSKKIQLNLLRTI